MNDELLLQKLNTIADHLRAISGAYRVVDDAIELLKGYAKVMEPMKPVLKGQMWECPVCHHPVGIFRDDDWCDYCPKCGKAMLWMEETNG